MSAAKDHGECLENHGDVVPRLTFPMSYWLMIGWVKNFFHFIVIQTIIRFVLLIRERSMVGWGTIHEPKLVALCVVTGVVLGMLITLKSWVNLIWVLRTVPVGDDGLLFSSRIRFIFYFFLAFVSLTVHISFTDSSMDDRNPQTFLSTQTW